MIKCLLLLIYIILSFTFNLNDSFAQNVKTGKSAATKYFLERKKETDSDQKQKIQNNSIRTPSSSGSARHLALHFGVYVDDEHYNWGEASTKDIGKSTIGVTYRMGEWTNSMDLSLRVDFNSFSLNDKKPLKMSLMPLITFPDVNSGFPLYFGAGLGLGVFFKQIEEESALSFDYQLILGARFLELFGNTGISIEAGLKNHLHLLSDGQYNGVFVSSGLVFNF